MQTHIISKDAFFWTLEGLCGLHRKPFSMALAQQQFVAPYTVDALQHAAVHYGFDASAHQRPVKKLSQEQFPLLVWCAVKEKFPPQIVDGFEDAHIHNGKDAHPENANEAMNASPAFILQADHERVLLIAPGDTEPTTLPIDQFAADYLGQGMRFTPQAEAGEDPDTVARKQRAFGFRWFIPELLKHQKLWQEVLLASLVIQLIALSTPLFTQTIIDKVVVHHTQSTLLVIVAGMSLFILFSAALTWLRQYLVLHTGNRVDAVLGAHVVEHLFHLPPQYFQHRPTGVIAARLHGVESIREFIASAAVTLILDLPFLLIFVAIMFYYSVSLTLIVLAVLSLIVALSLFVAPLFQTRLQEQFQLGARNQAFLTEYIVGLETVKSLQLEPQLNRRYGGYLASYLAAAFSTRQLANTYNSSANLLEQIMGLLILAIGAYSVMTRPDFTIGMLVAFQMYSGRLSQPMLRLVGLWQQFQQAKLSIDRLGDMMNVAPETYSVLPARSAAQTGQVTIDHLTFKYARDLPPVYQNLSLTIQPGQVVGIMGPSGCGKSTLAKLLQGFYQAESGRISIDGKDIRYLSANELRSHFGVVPQDTVLFSGTLYENLQMASPNARFEQITAACKMAEIHHVIEALPQGYQTQIGERGVGLSGGQKQRIAIARALLKRPSILIFDEATSALDGPTAEQFAHTINSLRGKVTMIFITHGLPKGLQVDAIYQLGPDGAQILEGAPANAQGDPATAVHSARRSFGIVAKE